MNQQKCKPYKKAMFVFWAVYYSIELTFCSDPEKVALILRQSSAIATNTTNNQTHEQSEPLQENAADGGTVQ